MKIRSLFFALLMLAAGMNTLFAADAKHKPSKKGDDDDKVKVVFAGYPFAFFSSTMKVGLEVPTGQSSSLYLLPSYTGTSYSNIYDVEELSDFSLEGQYRFYINRQGRMERLNGFYVSPFVGFHISSFRAYDPHSPSGTFTDLKAMTTNIGYYIGFQKIFKSGFTLNFYGGGGINTPSGSYDALDGFLSYSKGVRPRGGIAIGFAF